MDNPTIPTGHIEDVGALNLLSAKSADDFAGITKIEDVGVILVPQSLAMALMRIPMEDVGAIAPVPDGEEVVLINGQATLNADSLAAGDPSRLLLLVGQVVIEGVVTKIGYKGISIVGQVLATRGSEAALGAAIREMTGQLLYVPLGSRFIMGSEHFGREFLEALPNPSAFVVFGHVTFDANVDVDLLRRTIPEIVLFGHIEAPAHLVPTLQVITPQKFGQISAKE